MQFLLKISFFCPFFYFLLTVTKTNSCHRFFLKNLSFFGFFLFLPTIIKSHSCRKQNTKQVSMISPRTRIFLWLNSCSQALKYGVIFFFCSPFFLKKLKKLYTIARFFYRVLACSQECEGCLNFFYFHCSQPNLAKVFYR